MQLLLAINVSRDNLNINVRMFIAVAVPLLFMVLSLLPWRPLLHFAVLFKDGPCKYSH
ncbi:hypothetical protein BDR04DRAFT_570721 [Suillus decipiens]|nr:hypothetical protein BDR04DRAFT_570721 [Suillus decipiens]